MSFDVQPILEPGQLPTKATWYVISPEAEAEAGAEGQGGPVKYEAAPGGDPSPRVGACANFVQAEDTGVVLVSAGATPEGPYADLYQLTFKKDVMKWTSLPSDGLPPRYEHASFVSGSPSNTKASCDNLYVYSGARPEGPVSDMWRYDLTNKQWESVQMSGSIPSPRTYHSSSSLTADGNRLVVYSGGEAGVSPVRDQQTYLWDIASGKWSTLTTSGAPPPSPRQGHVAAVVSSKLYIHGGMAGEDIYSDLHCLDLETLKWSCPKVGGAAPPPLAAHGCAVIGSDVYMFGGLSPVFPGAQDSLYCLNTDTLMWSNVCISGPPPTARLDLAMCAVRIPVLSSARTAGSNSQGTACETRDKDVECAQGSFQAVTVIDPSEEDTSKSDFSVSESSSAPDRTVNLVTGELEGLRVGASKDVEKLSGEEAGSKGQVRGSKEGSKSQESQERSKGQLGESEEGSKGDADEECEWVPALFVFGGIDTVGNIFSDAYVFVPH